MSNRRHGKNQNKAAGGSGIAAPSPKSPSDQAGLKAQSKAQVLEKMAIKDMSSEQCFDFISFHVPYISTYKASWRIEGSVIAGCRPSEFEPRLRGELPFIPRSAIIEVFRAVQAKFAREWSVSGSTKDPTLSAERASEWANCPVPSAFQPSAADLAAINGSSAGNTGPNGAQVPPPTAQVQTQIPPPPDRNGNQVQSRVPPPPPGLMGSLLLPPFNQGLHGGGDYGSFHGGGASMFTPPPNSSKKFAFGRAPTPTALNLQLNFASPFSSTGHELPRLPTSAGELPRHQAGPALSGQSNPGSGVISSHPPGSDVLSRHQNDELPRHQNDELPRHQSSELPRQNEPGSGVISSHPPGQHILPLQQVHIDHSGKVFMPWEVEALQRPAKPFDPDMMPGFKRLSISRIIDKAKQVRIANKDSVSSATHIERVTYPRMKHFNVDDFLEARQAFYVATRKSTASCLFSEFKTCMEDSCRSACMRKFSLDEEQFIELDDAKLLSWLGIFFGPKNKSDAIDRLEKIRFPLHRDENHSQADFVDKLHDCAYEFEMSINDIANTHRSWSTSRTELSSGELSLKEVMEIWRRKFAKQDSSVYSVQLKFCRMHLDRDKEVLFNDIVLKLSDYFSSKDEDVKAGRSAYTTTPSKPQNTKRSPGSSFKLSSVGGGDGSAAHDGGGGYSSGPKRGSAFLGKRERPSQADPKAKQSRPQARITKGKDRCVCCGSNTNHWGLGISACPAKGTKYAVPRGHVWKDSDQEKSIVIPNPEFQEILKANPALVKAQAAAKDSWKLQRHQSRISALAAGEPLSSTEDESELDSDDAKAAADEFAQSGDDDAVNEDQCHVSALAAVRFENGSHIVAEENLPQFFGVVQIIGDDGIKHLAKALIDPGGTMNIISSKFRDMCSLETRRVNIKFFQGDTFQRSAKEGLGVISLQIRSSAQCSRVC